MKNNGYFNRQSLEQRIGHDEGILHDILTIFVEQTPQRMQDLRLALAASDLKKAKATAHSLAGALGSVSVDAVAEQARALEVAAARGDLATATGTLARLEPMFEDAVAEMRDLLAGSVAR